MASARSDPRWARRLRSLEVWRAFRENGRILGHAPDNYADTEQTGRGLEGFRKTFKANPPPNPHSKAMPLLASQKSSLVGRGALMVLARKA